MSKIAVVYWSGTGNTKAMADAVEEGAKGKGAEVSVLEASEFTSKQAGDFVMASGCGTGRTGAGQPVPNWSQTA